MTVTIIGTGLIGCSLAIRLKETGFAQKIIGVDNNADHLKTAGELGWIDVALPLDEAIGQSELIVIAIPVDATLQLLSGILNKLDTQVLMDVGSTKYIICQSVAGNKNRGRFAATHPMWGTEKDGPAAAEKNAFTSRVAVICKKTKQMQMHCKWLSNCTKK